MRLQALLWENRMQRGRECGKTEGWRVAKTFKQMRKTIEKKNGAPMAPGVTAVGDETDVDRLRHVETGHYHWRRDNAGWRCEALRRRMVRCLG